MRAVVLLLLTVAALADPVRHLPELARPEAWQVSAGGELRTADSSHLTLAFPGGEDLRMMLAKPIPLPEDVRDVSFLLTNNGDAVKLRVHVLIADAEGLEYVYNTHSDLMIKRPEGLYGMTAAGHRSTELRHHTPGLRHADIRRTIRPAKPNRPPARPFTWTGLLVETRVNDAGPKPRAPELYFADFAISSLEPKDSALYYQFGDRECLGEVDGLPYLTPGQFWWWPGTYRIAWDLRDRFAGQPFLFGGAELTATEAGATPLAVQLARHLEIPVREQGTYWVRVRVQRTDEGPHFRYYQRVEQYEYRLDVLEGDAPAARTPGGRGEFHRIAIAPERESLVYDFAEPFAVPVVLDRPGEGDWQARIVARSTTLGTTVREQETPLTWDAQGRWRTVLELGDQPPGGYEVAVTVIGPDGQPWDLAKRMIARRADSTAPAAPIPDAVPSARDLLAGDEPLFHLDATYHTQQRLDDPLAAWEHGFKPFLEEAGTLSDDLEFTVFWRLAEPVPGVYDWRETERFLDAAHARGLRVLLRLDFRGPAVPEWLPGYFVRDRAGHAFGHTAYLFHGMQPNFYHANELRWALNRFLLAAVRHFRGHPAVQGYYHVAEHPGDAPWSGFHGGHAPETIEDFRVHLLARYGDIDALNAALGTRFAVWEDIGGVDASPRFRLAWLRFRQEAVASASREFVRGARWIDPRRQLMVYAARDEAAWFAGHGAMTANGGTHDAHMPGYLGMALDGFQMRNEEISPRHWSGTGPYQLDATLFHAAVAGGAHSHCKAFIATWLRFADCQGPPRSLDKYARFQDIWRELRPTEPMPVEAFAFVDEASFLLEVNAVGVGMTPGGWTTENFQAAHLPVAMAPYEHWRQARLLIATGEYVQQLEAATIDRLVAYVAAGGCLYMRADAGRHCLERPDADWVLLRRLGFAAPTGAVDGRYLFARTADGERCRLRDAWLVPHQGEPLATFEHADAPALSRRDFGQGQVFVRWTQSAPPPWHEGGHSLLADVVEHAGVRRHALADNPRLWTYLLKHRDRPLYYGLVHAGPWHRAPNEDAVAGRVRWPHLPAGRYRIRELITDRDLGPRAAADLRAKGLELRLEPRQVMIFKLQLEPETPEP